MEIRDQPLHSFKPVAGIDEDLRPFGLCFETAIVIDQALQRTAGCGSYADDPSTLRLCFIEDRRGFITDHAQF